MILADTSVWIAHLREGSPVLAGALENARVLKHPFVIGELACGNLSNRNVILGLLDALPSAPTATDPEVLTFIDQHSLMGRGVGYIDVHLLASVALAASARLWTLDKRLATIAAELGVANVVE